MQTTESYPLQVLYALTKIEQDLPALVGEADWQQIGSQVNQTLAKLRDASDPDQQAVLALELIDLLSHYPTADRQLRHVLNANSEEQLAFAAYLQEQVKPALLEIATREGISPVEVEQILAQLLESTTIIQDDSAIKGLSLSQGGIDGGKLTGVNYLDIDLLKLGAFLSGAVLTIVGIIPTPWLFPLALIVTLAPLQDMTTKNLEIQDATVLWGLMHAAGRPSNPVREYSVFEATNKERQRFELHSLSEEVVRSSLNTLKRLGIATYDKEANQWSFVERIKITD